MFHEFFDELLEAANEMTDISADTLFDMTVEAAETIEELLDEE